MTKKINKNLVAVYGSLRQGLGNHRLLADANYLGTFTTPSAYSLYSLGGFPGLKPGGNTAVVMEVYEVTDEELVRINRLEGYTPGGMNSFYDRIIIDTPYGDAYAYEYMPDISKLHKVESGDWKTYKNNKELVN